MGSGNSMNVRPRWVDRRARVGGAAVSPAGARNAMTRTATGTATVAIALASLLGWGIAPAAAERLENQVAVFAALDKVTARISKLPVPLNETQVFGSLKVTPRVCYSRPPDEQPKTTTFVEVEEVMLDGQQKRLFSGWMFADSPGLNAVEHPVFDVWLTGCEQPVASGARPVARDGKGAPAQGKDDQPDPSRRRVRR